MPDVSICVANLGKKYRLRHQQQEGRRYKTLRDVLTSAPRRLLSAIPLIGSQQIRVGNQPSTEDFWALDDVSFNVEVGESVGIVGRNGAGKSTLLKILSRITEPTRGRIEILGRVASLLEVGTGFHPELTGRENIFLNGAILGMSRSEMRSKFDEIVEFAEVAKFLDTPVKRYSSGMYMRLAFSVAAHLESEVLIVDEVLSVGDAQFQKRCMDKMGQVSRAGRTVLFVSHNLSSIRHLCQRVILLAKGAKIFDGDCNEGISLYLQSNTESSNSADRLIEPKNPADPVRLARIRLCNSQGDACPSLQFGEPFRIAVEVESTIVIEDVIIGITIATSEGARLLTSHSNDVDQKSRHLSPGRNEFVCTIDPNVMLPGNYYIDVGIVDNTWSLLTYLEGAMAFSIEDVSFSTPSLSARRPGIIAIAYGWS